MWLRGFVLLFICRFAVEVNAQDRCGTPNQTPEESALFENWMQKRQLEKNLSLGLNRIAGTVYIIPVVVHVIHRGEAIGVGDNLSDAKIQEQIDILNQDFRKLNPRAGSVPSVFKPVEADIEVQFVLARQDPNGLATTGIVRKMGTKASYVFPGNDLKAESYWPSEDYMNIWIAQTNYLGYATFPTGSGLPGISGETNPLRDGLVVDTNWWGINDNTGGSFDSYGQTATHEIGHFLGLKHIWGDSDSCGATDYCADTPPAFSDNGGIGSPCSQVLNSCTNDSPDLPDMFMNYMDYTNDECMNMFTFDQKFRMRTVLENSPRRLSLLTSHGLEYPTVITKDLAMSRVSGLPFLTCENGLAPAITFLNKGSHPVTEFRFSYTINAITSERLETDLNLLPGQEHTVLLEYPNLTDGNYSLRWEILEVNGSADDDITNDAISSLAKIKTDEFDTPFRETFTQHNWLATALEAPSQWQATSPLGNDAMYIPAFSTGANHESWLVSPVFSLANYTEVGIFFKLSYATRGTADKLDLRVSTGCLTDFETVWSSQLDDMDFPTNSTAWTPQNESDWQEIFINLTDYKGANSVRMAFVFTNNNGNNLYLDDIELTNNKNPNQPRLKSGTFVVYPNPAQNEFQLTLNLPESQSIRIRLIDITGKIVHDENRENILNQTLTYKTPNQFGMYFLHITGKDIDQKQRILISR